MENILESEKIKIYHVADSDGKCFKCGNFCMDCGCFFQGLDFSFINKEMALNPNQSIDKSK